MNTRKTECMTIPESYRHGWQFGTDCEIRHNLCSLQGKPSSHLFSLKDRTLFHLNAKEKKT